MFGRLSLRVKLSLVVVLLVAGFSVFSALSLYRMVKIDIAIVERIRILGDLRLALLYFDLADSGGWRAKDGVLYKGKLRISGNPDALEGLLSYLSPDIELFFGVGLPPRHLPENDDVSLAGATFLRYVLEKTIKRYWDVEDFKILKNVYFPAEDEVVLTLSGVEGSPAGWIALKDRGDLRYDIQHTSLLFFALTSFIVIVLISTFLYVIIFRISAPIDQLVLRNKHMTLKNKELFTQARTDHLTGLLNRRGLSEILKNEVEDMVASGEAVTIALLDIDNFKKINDTWGHDSGDFVLLELGKLVNASVRGQDMAFRWGGEEFLVLFPELEEARMKEAAERVMAAIANHEFLHNGIRIPVTVTIGIARCSKECSFAEAVSRADKGLYFGKRHGKNRVCSLEDAENEGPLPEKECSESS